MAVRIIQWKSERNADGRIAAASIVCPGCGERTHTGDHAILENGKIIPAVECDHSCSFHDHVELAGWCHGFIPRGGPL